MPREAFSFSGARATNQERERDDVNSFSLQKKLPLGKPRRAAKTNLERSYERDNLQAARIIALDPDSFGGNEALAVVWSRRVLAARGLDHRPHLMGLETGGSAR
jgi:hypothetical protein